MMQNKCYRRPIPILLSLSLLSLPATPLAADFQAPDEPPVQQLFTYSTLEYTEKQWVGRKIYQNECASNPAYLTYWGKGEEFPSFGIGHFIWYPPGVDGKFKETFPQMVNYVSQFSEAPGWLLKLEPFKSPWHNKTSFDQAWSSVRLMQLREWLLATQAYQSEFIVQQAMSRFQNKLLEVPVTQIGMHKAYVEKMLSFKEGRFAFVDYINFKGVGESHEQYQGQAWGLLSVIQQMHENGVEIDKVSNQDLLHEFVKSAKQRLTLRTELAPMSRNEKRWLKGWFKRVEGYLID